MVNGDMMVKGPGPSLPVFGALPDPVLTVFSAQREPWLNNRMTGSHMLPLRSPHLATPSSAKESALVVALAPGAYTDFIRQFAGGNRCAPYRKYPAGQEGKISMISKGKHGRVC